MSQPFRLDAGAEDAEERAARFRSLIVGTSAPIRRMRQLISMVAPSTGTVLIVGPTGAGKELVAQSIHRESGRKGRMVALNCAAIPSELLESELFGYEKGAFTGADRQRAGRFEQASGGTLFLDEIGDLPLALQSKLLRVLETRVVQRIGGREDIALDFRLVCATHRDLAAKAESGEFRADLYYRLNVLPIEVPGLAERRADIPLIVEAMLVERRRSDPALPLPEFDQGAIKALCDFPWPGNVRELRNVVDRACILFAGGTVTARNVRENLIHLRLPDPTQPDPEDDLWEELGDLAGVERERAISDPIDLTSQAEAYRRWFDHHAEIDLRGHVRDIEVVLIEAALDKHDGLVSRAAEVLKLRRTTLIEKMKKLMITRPGTAERGRSTG
jgi:sigma-54 specific flagellar transcriptional regulator A